MTHNYHNYSRYKKNAAVRIQIFVKNVRRTPEHWGLFRRERCFHHGRYRFHGESVDRKVVEIVSQNRKIVPVDAEQERQNQRNARSGDSGVGGKF